MNDRPGDNPYRPGAALAPPVLAGRARELNHYRSALRSAPGIPANVRLTGLRGVGKTVLLQQMESLPVQEGWLASRCQVEPRHNDDRHLAALVQDLARAARSKLSRLTRLQSAVQSVGTTAVGAMRVEWHDVALSLAWPQAPTRGSEVAQALFEAAAQAVRSGRRGYMLMLDEAQALRDGPEGSERHPLSMLVAAVNVLQEQGVPVGLTLSGLPNLASNLLKARTYAERMFRGDDIGGLTRGQAVEALVRPLEGSGVTVAPEMLDAVWDTIEGYPYFVQVWGAELWEAAHLAQMQHWTRALLDAVEPDIYRRLDLDFYDARVDALRPAEQDLLSAAAACPYPPWRTADLRAVVRKSGAHVNVLLGGLVEQGILFRTRRGEFLYAAPKFHAYLARRAAGRRDPA